MYAAHVSRGAGRPSSRMSKGQYGDIVDFGMCVSLDISKCLAKQLKLHLLFYLQDLFK